MAMSGHHDKVRAGLADVPQDLLHRFVEFGETVEEILRHIRESGTDLVMMPTHGHGAFRRLLVGSITNKLLHDATCPVWTDAHIEEIPIGLRDECTDVFCGLDLTDKAHDVKLIQ